MTFDVSKIPKEAAIHVLQQRFFEKINPTNTGRDSNRSRASRLGISLVAMRTLKRIDSILRNYYEVLLSDFQRYNLSSFYEFYDLTYKPDFSRLNIPSPLAKRMNDIVREYNLSSKRLVDLLGEEFADGLIQESQLEAFENRCSKLYQVVNESVECLVTENKRLVELENSLKIQQQTLEQEILAKNQTALTGDVSSGIKRKAPEANSQEESNIENRLADLRIEEKNVLLQKRTIQNQYNEQCEILHQLALEEEVDDIPKLF